MTEQEKNSIINKTMSSDDWKEDVARFPKEWQKQVEAAMARALGHGIYSATFVKPDLVEATNGK
jgi:hypothetical protein